MSKRGKYWLEESTKSYLTDVESYYEEKEDSFVFAVQQSNELHYISGVLNDDVQSFFDVLSNFTEKENIYLKAIKNLLKQKEYINLMYELSNKYISLEEFSEELEKNEEKYLIKIDKELNVKSYELLRDILIKLDADFTDDDVSEIFSVKTKNLVRNIGNKTRRENESCPR